MGQEEPVLEQDPVQLAALVREQRAALSTYKETLARIYQEFDAKIDELSLIRRVSDVLRQTQDLRGMALALVEVVISELPADLASLLLTDPEMTTLTPLAWHSREWDRPRPAEALPLAGGVPLGQGPLGRAVESGRVLIIPSLSAEPLDPWLPGLPHQAQSLMALPLVARQQILGAMLLVSLSPEAFAEEHTRTLTIICDHAASALVNVRLIEQLGEINERLLASELEAHQAREYLQRLLDTARDLILIADHEGKITYANQASHQLGFSREQLIGQPVAQLFAQPLPDPSLWNLPEARDQELKMVTIAGETRHALVSATPLAETGEVLAIVKDITQRRALERQLLHAEKLASVGILAAGVAHEIGNPLSAISGYAQILAKDDITPEERREFAQSIDSLAERINNIIRDLLEYSRPSPYAGQATAVNQAVEAVLNMFFTQKRLSSYQLSIKRDLSRDLPLVVIDKDQLQQVVLNMVMNAAQAMEQGGVLGITTRQKGKRLAISFADTGPGIPAGHLPLIFDPFFTTKPPGRGTGLGLSICDRIIRQAGGNIEVSTRPGKGTTFTVWLPAAGPAGAEVEE